MESMMESFLAIQQQQNEMIKQLASRVDQLATHNKNLENQITRWPVFHANKVENYQVNLR